MSVTPDLGEAKQATVEVLTAEVRVLMVGSRQVTLSVARQLDDVCAEDLVPFGRINTGRKSKPRERIIEAIGSYGGVLARAVVIAEKVVCMGRPDRRLEYVVGDQYLECDKEEPHARHHWTVHYPDEEMWSEWQMLPLIVLAGLK